MPGPSPMGVKRKDASLGLSYPLAEGTPGFKRARKRKILPLQAMPGSQQPQNCCAFLLFWKVTFLSCFLVISFLLMEVFVDGCGVFLVHFISPGCDIIFLKGQSCLQNM